MTEFTTALAFALHLLSAIVWIGGMFFAYMALRPAAVVTLAPPQRLQLWARTLAGFFPWVFIAIILLLSTGLWMLHSQKLALTAYLHTMIGLGVVMMLIFGHVYFAAFKRLRQAVAIEDWESAAARLAQIRKLVAVNLSIGILLVLAVSLLKRLSW